MYKGFPTELVARLRCPRDGVPLHVDSADCGPNLLKGSLACRHCGAQYPIEEGIVRLLDPALLDEESGHERAVRDRQAEGYDPAAEGSVWQAMEMEPTIAALGPLAGRRVLEIGCGTGRYTTRIAGAAAEILAVDFSLASLQTLASRALPDWRLGLVQADATRVSFQRGAFDVALSTLVSNLPSLEHRCRMMSIVADALRPDGSFVFSTHYYNLPSRLAGIARSGHYRAGGIYRYLFPRAEIVRETRPHFRNVSCRPIQVPVPLARRFGLPAVTLSRLAGRLPLVRMLGELLLLKAVAPRAANAE